MGTAIIIGILAIIVVIAVISSVKHMKGEGGCCGGGGRPIKPGSKYHEKIFPPPGWQPRFGQRSLARLFGPMGRARAARGVRRQTGRWSANRLQGPHAPRHHHPHHRGPALERRKVPARRDGRATACANRPGPVLQSAAATIRV